MAYLFATLIDGEPEKDVTETRCYEYLQNAKNNATNTLNRSLIDWHYAELSDADMEDMEDEHRQAKSVLNAWDGTGDSVEYVITSPEDVEYTYRIYTGPCTCR